jgi:hypothetical protein
VTSSGIKPTTYWFVHQPTTVNYYETLLNSNRKTLDIQNTYSQWIEKFWKEKYVTKTGKEENIFVIIWLLENSVLRRIFGPKRDEVTEDWRKLHNKELQVKEDEMGGARSANRGEEKCI